MNTVFLKKCRKRICQQNKAHIVVEALGLMAVGAVLLFASPMVAQAKLNHSLLTLGSPFPNLNSQTFSVGSRIIIPTSSISIQKDPTATPALSIEGHPSSTGNFPSTEGPDTAASPIDEMLFVDPKPITSKDNIVKGDWITIFMTANGKKKEFAAAVLTVPKVGIKPKLGTVLVYLPLDPSDTQGAKLKGQIVNALFP